MPIVSTSTSAFYERARASMKDLRSQAETLQAQLGSGEKLTRASDDPVAAARLRTLSRLESLSSIDTTNADRANADLSLADSAISNMATTIIRAQELATQAASSTLTDQQRAGIGAELDQIHDDLISLANSRDSNGHALFGGESAGNAYSVDASGNAVYIGTNSTGDLPIGDGQTVARSITGPQIFSFTDASGNTTDVMATVKALSDALKGGSTDPAGAAADALESLKQGIDTLTTGQTVVGTRLAWLDVVSERRSTLTELRTTEEASLGGTDIASTVAQLQQTLTVLEASQASFTKLSGLSLFDNLR
ncbi:flagellar hook-associated protein FlgL [Novosphingobium mangrovi (ex Huang et al. 2023)]|uniref:Flagellar hook-associated protein FlgL n=1 Tax=Novosphingobium mangrovi (ex Huang et al. 2023) TaxID=2976432 RepID=A0ABT2I033_9SPHN|nr:flagellar hook-associated protein FlgL [Novosphingobium mangrovi (ex Huang et al. 2023)]MCT2398161.1 flagellar hook-associated protein FlgL [Novosphingobium mangrovi (ex Huang et al. 2023)]